MGMAYKCDICGRYFEWYEVAHFDKKFNNMTYKEEREWEQNHPNAKYFESNRAWMSVNCLQLRQFDPINDNMVTNEGVLSGEIHDPEDGNYPLIVLCADCMTDFLKKIDGLWKNH